MSYQIENIIKEIEIVKKKKNKIEILELKSTTGIKTHSRHSAADLSRQEKSADMNIGQLSLQSLGTERKVIDGAEDTAHILKFHNASP